MRVAPHGSGMVSDTDEPPGERSTPRTPLSGKLSFAVVASLRMIVSSATPVPGLRLPSAQRQTDVRPRQSPLRTVPGTSDPPLPWYVGRSTGGARWRPPSVCEALAPPLRSGARFGREAREVAVVLGSTREQVGQG